MDLLFRAADLLERAIESAVRGVDDVDVAPIVAQLKAEAVRSGTPAYSSLAVTSEFSIGMTSEFPIAVTNEFPVPVVDGWTAPAPAGEGMLVRIRLVAGTPLKGVRAFLVVEAREEARDGRRRIAGDRAAPGRRVRARLRAPAHDRS